MVKVKIIKIYKWKLYNLEEFLKWVNFYMVFWRIFYIEFGESLLVVGLFYIIVLIFFKLVLCYILIIKNNLFY